MRFRKRGVFGLDTNQMQKVAEVDNVILTSFVKHGGKVRTSHIEEDSKLIMGRNLSRETISKHLKEYRKHCIVKPAYYSGLSKYHEHVSGKLIQPCNVLAPIRMKTNRGKFFNLILFEKL